MSKEIPKDSSFLSSKETGTSMSNDPVSPAKKIRTSMSTQESPETTQASSVLPSKKTEESRLFGVYTSPAKKIQEEQRVPSKKTEVRLFGVSLPLSSASSTNTDEELKKTICLKDPKKGFVSTTLCFYDETWPCGNPDYPTVTCAPRNKLAEQRKIKENKEDEDQQYETGQWIIKKELNTTDICRQLHLRKADVECHILSYLSEDDQKKLVQGDRITINMYDHESDTTHRVLMMRWISKTNYYCLKNSWRKDFVYRRGLRAGDKIGLSWDRFRYKLHFRVLSRATKKPPAEEKKQAGISTEPSTLYTWTIEKTLTESDVNHLNRLMVGNSDAESHIMRHLSTDVQQTIQKGKKFNVKAYDHDTDTEHDMVFLRYVETTNNYVFNRGWAKEFVRRRDLKQGDKIGLFWGNVDSRLHFCVLQRNPN
ncbi:DNA-binding pseudobarrel domain superfamily [Arabidopsis thaliana x Arabidopsis arenosa]|uniref:DNA-binding pseudobarrel domain superfamily n=1 Tax=Arabidopsis thaliana x Arabidopsis arenosa TaxID=1240361 RepID=A0A8T2BVJ1_9BRAS|nr:DNA-binding pseudobarrel domain superfamily [Arabidopsis thaliana x Arabidopsis arenosa]